METNTVDIAGKFTSRMLKPMARYAWLGWALPVALVLFLSLRQIGTADFWWQWSTGRWILDNGIPTHDPWLTTAEPRSWIETRWLYCVALYWSFENVGAWLPIIAVAAIYALGAGFALRAGNRAAPSWIAIAGVGLAAVAGRRFVVRPEAFTFLFLAATLWLIIRMRTDRLKSEWGVFWIGAVQVVWANTHALFAAGTGLCVVWLIVEAVSKGKLWKAALAAVAVSAVAALINPYGVHGALFPFVLLEELHVGAYRNNIVELRSPFAFGLSPSLIAHMALAAMVGWLAIRKRGDTFLLLACAATFYLSVTVVRNAPLFGLCAVAYISTCDLKPHKAPAWLATLCAAAIAYSFAIGAWTLEDRLGLSLDRSRYALPSAQTLVNEKGEVFNTLVEGSLLIVQRQRVFSDPRLEVLPQERFVEMLDYSRLIKPIPENFTVLLLTVDCPLTAKIIKDGGWRITGIDPLGIAFVREDGATINPSEVVAMASETIDLNPPEFSFFSRAKSPIPYRRLAMLFHNIGEEKAAADMRALARRVYPTR
ncbi:MAG: hypothetical protein ABIV13_04900 [Fimbriimonadales bacterium]